MDWRALVFGATLFIALAALTSIASSKVGEPDANGAVASALRHHLTDFWGVGVINGKDAAFGRLVLCVGSKVPLNMAAIERDFAGTAVQPLADDACTRETVEDHFGMFAAITRYHDPDGDEAAHLEVVDVSCSSSTICVVDIDGVGSGERYVTRREGRAWSVIERQMRWVV